MEWVRRRVGETALKATTRNVKEQEPWGRGGAHCLKDFSVWLCFCWLFACNIRWGGVLSGQLAGEVEWMEAGHRSQGGVWRCCLSSGRLWLTAGRVQMQPASPPFRVFHDPHTHLFVLSVLWILWSQRISQPTGKNEQKWQHLQWIAQLRTGV